MEWEKLLNTDLLLYCSMFTFFAAAVKNKLEEKHVLDGWLWAVALLTGFAFSFWIASIWHSYLPAETVPAMENDWRLQGAIGGIWIGLTNMVAQATFGSGKVVTQPDALRAVIAKAPTDVVVDAGVTMKVNKPVVEE